MAILTYHHIGNCPPEQKEHPGLWVTPELFEAQLQWLKEHGVTGLTLVDILRRLQDNLSFPARWVSITFDDGWRDNFTLAAPLLHKYGFHASIFMVTSQIRDAQPSGDWDDYLSAPELQELMKAGHYIGNHTHTHPRLTKLNDAAVTDEFTRSRKVLSDVLCSAESQPGGDWLCYPYGNFSPRIAALAEKAGFTGALSTIRDNQVNLSQMFWMPRVMIMGDTPPERFSYLLSRRYHWLHSFKNRKRWRSIK